MAVFRFADVSIGSLPPIEARGGGEDFGNKGLAKRKFVKCTIFGPAQTTQ